MKKTETKKTKILLRVLEFLKPFKYLFILSLILNAIFSALSTLSVSLIQPVLKILFANDTSKSISPAGKAIPGSLSKNFFDYIMNIVHSNSGLVQSLINLSILIIIVFVLKNIFKYLSSVTATRLQEGIIKSIRDRVFERLSTLSVDFFAKSKQGTLMSVITNDVGVISGNMINSFSGLLRDSIQVILFLGFLISLSLKLTLISFSTSIISFIVIRYTLRYLKRYATRMQNAMADYTGTLHETISGIRVVKAYNAENTVAEKFRGESGFYVRSAVKLSKITSLIPALNEVFAIFALCVVLFVGGSQVIHGEIAPENLMTFLFVLFSIMSPISNVTGIITGYQHGFVAAERVFKILDTEPSVPDGHEELDSFKSEIKVEDVRFAYEERDVLSNIDIKIEKGKRIAFVGSSGSGKSTMLDIIIRFYDPNTGKVTIDGKDISKLKLKSYRSIFGIVSQENMLFNDTVANNIRYGLTNATEEDIVNAAKNANAYDFIMKMPKGFETTLGDRGVTISGGERQRLAIARALVRDPQILIFDEATSQLDAESEKIVQEAINHSLEDKTAIIVAHRLATIINCDEIHVFENGRIVESGSHGDLLAKNGVYRKLYDIQFAQKALGLDD